MKRKMEKMQIKSNQTGPGACFAKLFTAVINSYSRKLECLSLSVRQIERYREIQRVRKRETEQERGRYRKEETEEEGQG
jgi:hypothetical protein